MTAALEGGEWSAARFVRTLPPWKTRYPLHRRLDGPQGRSGRAENLGIRSRTIQPVAQSLYRLSYPAHTHIYMSKGKAVPLQARSGPEVSRKLSFPDFVTTAQDGGTHRPSLPPRNASGTHFSERLSRPQSPRSEGFYDNKKIHWHQLGSNQRPL